MRLHQLKPAPGSRPSKHIVGRGEGSGLGQTCGKGQKGQNSRSGETAMIGFEGGQMPLMRRIPKRGFRHASKIHYVPVDVQVLEAKFDTGAEVSGKTLKSKGLLSCEMTPVKVVGNAKIKKSLKLVGLKTTKPAAKVITEAGGSIA